jgi:hypothetical protein
MESPAAPPVEPNLANKPVPAATSQVTFRDRMIHWRARFGIRRMHFRVKPGLYRLGTPDETSPVFASANYQLSFDALRSSLSGMRALGRSQLRNFTRSLNPFGALDPRLSPTGRGRRRLRRRGRSRNGDSAPHQPRFARRPLPA